MNTQQNVTKNKVGLLKLLAATLGSVSQFARVGNDMWRYRAGGPMALAGSMPEPLPSKRAGPKKSRLDDLPRWSPMRRRERPRSGSPTGMKSE